MKKKTKYWIAVVACVLLALYFFMWAIQTAWLGSFPGRDIEAYTRWTYMQLVVSIAFLVAAIVSFIKAWRYRE